MNDQEPSASAIRWRMRRGMKELDLVLGRWFEARYEGASSDERRAFLELLDLEDPDIWSWLMGYRPVPENPVGELVVELREYR